MEQKDMFGTLPMGQLITKMSVPGVVEMIFQSLYNIVDSLFVARLSLNALTAVGLVFPVQMVMIALASGIGAGMNSLVSRRMGGKDIQGAGKAVGNAIALGAVCSVIMILFGIFCAKPFFALSTSNPEIASYGISYLSICCIFGFGAFFSVIGERMLQAAGQPAWSMITHVIGCIVNIVFDPILIFGLCGFPAMGVTGAAVATVSGQIVSTAVAFYICIIRQKGIPFTLKDIHPSEEIRTICSVGIPAAAAQGLSSVMSFGMNQILKNEAVGLAVFTAYYKLWSFVGCLVIGLLQGTIPIVGYNYGAKNRKRLSDVIKKTLLIGIVMMAVCTVVFQILPGQLIALFDNGSNGDIFMNAGVHALRIISWIFVPYAVGQICSNIFQGMGKGGPSLIYALLHQCVLLLPTAYLLLKASGMNFIWYAYWSAQIVAVTVVVIIFRFYYKKYVLTLS